MVNDGDTKRTLIFGDSKMKILAVLPTATHACLLMNSVNYNETEPKTFET